MQKMWLPTSDVQRTETCFSGRNNVVVTSAPYFNPTSPTVWGPPGRHPHQICASSRQLCPISQQVLASANMGRRKVASLTSSLYFASTFPTVAPGFLDPTSMKALIQMSFSSIDLRKLAESRTCTQGRPFVGPIKSLLGAVFSCLMWFEDAPCRFCTLRGMTYWG